MRFKTLDKAQVPPSMKVVWGNGSQSEGLRQLPKGAQNNLQVFE